MKTNNLAERIYQRKTIIKIHKKVRMANLNININKFLIQRIIICLIIYGVSTFIPKVGLIVAPFITILYYNLTERITLDAKIQKRNLKMEKEIILFIENTLIALKNYQNLKVSLETTCEHNQGEISFEIKRALNESSLGKNLNEAFNNIIAIIPNQNVINFINTLNQTSTENIIPALESQLKYLKDNKNNNIRIQQLHKLISVCLISTIFISIIIILIVMTPNLIEVLK